MESWRKHWTLQWLAIVATVLLSVAPTISRAHAGPQTIQAALCAISPGKTESIRLLPGERFINAPAQKTPDLQHVDAGHCEYCSLGNHLLPFANATFGLPYFAQTPSQTGDGWRPAVLTARFERYLLRDPPLFA